MSVEAVCFLDRIAPRLTGMSVANADLFIFHIVGGIPDIVATHLARHPSIRRHIAICRDHDHGRSISWSAYDTGGFEPAEFIAALHQDDPASRLFERDEERLYALVSRRYGAKFSTLDDARLPVDARRPVAAATSRLSAARLETGGRIVTVLAPLPADLIATLSLLAPTTSPVVTTPRRLHDILAGEIGREELSRAVSRLQRLDPELSAHHSPTGAQKLAIGGLMAGLVFGFSTAPQTTGILAFCVSAICFLAIGWTRVRAAELVDKPEVVAKILPDRDLPTYCVLIPLYHEAHMVVGLMAQLSLVRYPHDRLDLVFLVEADDVATRQAVGHAVRGKTFARALVVPPGNPRTKPRALCYGLAFSRSALVTVFDAEDRPDPDQLRRAATALVNGPVHLACVQARLEIDRNRIGVQDQFALEYAALFSGLLPWLARDRMPLPLGGTSNHFKRSALEEVGGWDPYNVTEDADLGIRLARYGFTSACVDSTTFEEAPNRLAVWHRQRVRWIKGWMMTALVHGRRPRELIREIGWRATLLLYIQFAAMIMAPLTHPFGLALLGLYATGMAHPPMDDSLPVTMLVVTNILGLIAGYAGNFWLATKVIRRMGRRDLGRARWLMPLYWLLISFAAWTALAELLLRPHHWAKTPHQEPQPVNDAS